MPPEGMARCGDSINDSQNTHIQIDLLQTSVRGHVDVAGGFVAHEDADVGQQRCACEVEHLLFPRR